MTLDINNLKWNRFNENLDFNLKELLFGNKLTDVTLVSDDKIAFKTHKFLLGACSPVLREILIETFYPQPTIYLRGIHSHELKAILYFLYLGKTRFYHTRKKKFFKVGKTLQINQLNDDLAMESDIDDSVIESDDSKDINKTYSSTEQKLSKNKNEEGGHIKQFESPGCNLGVTEADLNTNNKYFTCEECKVEFRSKKGLILHIRSRHKEVKYSCDSCDYKATDLGNLKKHKESVHEGV